MKFLSVDQSDYLRVAVEELEALSTELSGEVLVEAPEVQEELTEQMNTLQGVRNNIVENGMTKEAARQVNAAVENFLIRNHISVFTSTPSIEGLSTALEAVDEQRTTVLQKIIAWFKERLDKFIAWASKLFEKDGKAEKAAHNAKEMARECEESRNAKEVGKMAKDPATAVQEVRIDPSEEKSGTFEEFVDALEKNMEPVKADISKLYSRLNANKVMRVVATNPESVRSFFEHMQSTTAHISAVRGLIDEAARKIAAATNAQQTISDIKMSRMMIYRQLGGEGPEVLGSIRQNQFKDDATEITPESVPYDQLIPAICTATRDVSAANAGTRIRDLAMLKKAVEQLGAMEYSSISKMSPQDRDVVLSAAKGLVEDVSKYVSADVENWNCMLRIFSGASAFFTSELAVYYRVIGAIQRAATSTLAEADRKVLFEEFKKKGFNMDISQEELTRRGVGMESFAEYEPVFVALESINVEYPGSFPQERIFIGGGLMAALEAEVDGAASTNKPGMGQRIIAWFRKLLEWVRSVFKGRAPELAKTISKAKERRNQQAAAATSASPADEASSKIFEGYLKDAGWWSSTFASQIETKVSGSFTLGLILKEETLAKALVEINTMVEAVNRLSAEVLVAKTQVAMTELGNSEHLKKFEQAKDALHALSNQISDGKFNDLQSAIDAVRGSQKHLASLGKLAGNIDGIVDKTANMSEAVDKFFNSNGSELDGAVSQGLHSTLQTLGKIPKEVMDVLTTVAMAYSQALVGMPLDRQEILAKISEHQVEQGKEALTAAQRASLLVSTMWWDAAAATENYEAMVFAREASFALESLEEYAPDIWGAIPSLSAALESDESQEQRNMTLWQHVKKVLTRIAEWFRNLFSKKKKVSESRLNDVRESVKKQREEAMKAPKETLRPDVLKIFEQYYTDSKWFAQSDFAKQQENAISRSGVSFMYGGLTFQQFYGMANDDMKVAVEFIRKVAGANNFAQLPEPPKTVTSDLDKITKTPTKFQTLKESVEIWAAWSRNGAGLKSLHDNLGAVEALASEATKRLLKIADGNKGDATQVKRVQEISAALVAYAKIVTVYAGYAMAAAVECMMPVGIHKRAAVVEILNHYKDNNPKSEMGFGETDIRLLLKDPRWHFDLVI